MDQKLGVWEKEISKDENVEDEDLSLCLAFSL